jgi:hypothetical protein
MKNRSITWPDQILSNFKVQWLSLRRPLLILESLPFEYYIFLRELKPQEYTPAPDIPLYTHQEKIRPFLIPKGSNPVPYTLTKTFDKGCETHKTRKCISPIA